MVDPQDEPTGGHYESVEEAHFPNVNRFGSRFWFTAGLAIVLLAIVVFLFVTMTSR